MIAIDLFAGGGGASEGIRQATGVSPIAALNHDEQALFMHEQNHPSSLHIREDIVKVRPHEVTLGQKVDLLWASPDCTHHSRAKGGKPLDNHSRGLAWMITEWAEYTRPKVICMENVPEFTSWGPLDKYGKPIKERAGEIFHEFIYTLQHMDYDVDWRNLTACDYGAPTTRKRFFMAARRDGDPIVWPTPSHGPGREHPYRTASECIDYSIEIPSIFTRKKKLADKTEKRIAEGIRKFVLDAKHRHLLVKTPGGSFAPVLVQSGYGEREGQRPRVLDLERPLGTVVAGGSKHALIGAFLSKHNGKTTGQGLLQPMHTITGVDTKSVVAVHIASHYGNSIGRGMERPLPTVTADGGGHSALVATNLIKLYGTSNGASVDKPMPTITAQGTHIGLVATFMERYCGIESGEDGVLIEIDGELYVIVDIGMRMLEPRELARAQGFEDSYILTGTKRNQTEKIGNSVCPQVARALVQSMFGLGPDRYREAA